VACQVWRFSSCTGFKISTARIFSSPKRWPTAHFGQRSPCSWYPVLEYRFGSVDGLEVFFSIWVNPEGASF